MKRGVAAVAAAAGALVCAAVPAAAQNRQIMSAVNADPVGRGDDRTVLGTVAGQGVSLTAGGSQSKVLTDYGVNKIYSTTDGSMKTYATSAWLDSYTATGAAGSTVRVDFTFTLDGKASFARGSGVDYNFNVMALRGDNWSLHGQGGTDVNYWVPQRTFGDDYESPLLSRPINDGQTIQTYLPRFATTGASLWNYSNDDGEIGAFGSRVRQTGQNFTVDTQDPTRPWLRISDVYTPTFTRRTTINMETGETTPGPMRTYANFPALAAVYQSLRANYPILGASSICAEYGEDDGLCLPGDYAPTDVTLSFDMAAGSSFSIAALLYADDLEQGTVDFYNTAKLSKIVATGGGLTSLNEQFRQNADGSFGYIAAAMGGVPEPATWALMILGFGGIGGALRGQRRPRGQRQPSTAASIAVAAPASA